MTSAKFFARAWQFIAIACLAGNSLARADFNRNTHEETIQDQSEGLTYWLDDTFANKKIHVLRIDLRNPNITFRASTENERNLTPSEFASRTGALAVINGDFFDGNKDTVGLAVGLGQKWSRSADTKEWSFVACDGTNNCVIDPYNSVTPMNPAWANVVGGWQILLDPEFTWTRTEDAQCKEFCQTEHPRTVVGLSADRSVMWWVMIEGRQGSLSGLSLSDSARVLKRLGAQWALNLDGGGSSGMILNGRRVNGRPFNEPSERRVANCLAIVRKP